MNSFSSRNRRKRGGRKATRKSLGSGLDKRVNVYTSAATQLRRDVGWLMSVVNVEDKYLDSLFNAAVLANGVGLQTLLNGTTTGNSAITRNGQSTKAQSLVINLIIRVGVTTPVNCRIIFALDRAANGTAFAASAIFQAAVDGANDFTTSQWNIATKGVRFNVLYDDIFLLDTVQNTYHKIQIHIPLGFHTRYNTGNAGTVGDISENSLYFLAMSGGTVTQPTFSGSVRFLFTDN